MIKQLISYKFPQNILISLNLIGLFLVILYNHQLDRLSLAVAAGLILIIYLSNFLLRKISKGDHYIFLVVSMLMSIGIIMIYRLDPALGVKQVIWFLVGIITLFISYFIVKFNKKWSQWIILYVALSLVLFLATLIFGSNIKGATNWIRIGSHSFQPVELIKILFVFFLASYYSNREKYQNKYIFFAIVYVHIVFLFLQKDLGSAMLFFMVFITVMYVYEAERLFILYNLGAASIMAVFSYFIFSHVRVRVETWIDPWKSISGKGYQITQSLFAIAAGGFLGTGIGRGHPKFIPEVHTDFIFSAICEEMGVLTGIAVVMLYIILVYRGIKIALEQRSQFYRIIALGITLVFGFQAFIILGGVTKMIPLTGITLPFLSYGGSSLVASFASLGILQATSEVLEDKNEEIEEEDDEDE
ncbi:FtsW/RodA/SpoVE family cell cycle protein [Irregularibacter muris]|uniref:FtsW/RodA/SpoVE family cell cycle protein n=1 Tax=Irregularibacter muris TaxID=1796619 RepID=A0AAE3HIL5_9FIRM|nr:FtsW/RodA/SpoVE family cell cycle protein [Irregularibacter muris]MCR1899599.1 FtsW/RodA/SpoVE family cell cycle protein [Irregularibacter muris]